METRNSEFNLHPFGIRNTNLRVSRDATEKRERETRRAQIRRGRDPMRASLSHIFHLPPTHLAPKSYRLGFVACFLALGIPPSPLRLNNKVKATCYIIKECIRQASLPSFHTSLNRFIASNTTLLPTTSFAFSELVHYPLHIKSSQQSRQDGRSSSRCRRDRRHPPRHQPQHQLRRGEG